jgi:DNA-binding LacI/PurR family transcriptional regulator
MSGKRRPTSNDVAARAGVSRATVSYVLNRKTAAGIKISKETEERVRRAVRDLGYRPSRAAIALRKGRTGLLALMVPDLETPYHPVVASAVQVAAERHGYDVLVYNTRDDPRRERGFVEWLVDRAADGAIIQSYNLDTADLETLHAHGIPVVVFGDSPRHPYADNVLYDEAGAARAVVGYLVEKGHRGIATITGPLRTWGGSYRLRGYRLGMEDARLAVDPMWIQEADFFSEGSAARSARTLVALPNRPTAIVAGSDFLAIHAQNVALDAGLRVPRDLAVVGFDDTLLARVARPALTTVAKSPVAQAEAALRLLIERMDTGTPPEARTVELPFELTRRDSA